MGISPAVCAIRRVPIILPLPRTRPACRMLGVAAIGTSRFGSHFGKTMIDFHSTSMYESWSPIGCGWIYATPSIVDTMEVSIMTLDRTIDKVDCILFVESRMKLQSW